MLNYLLLDGCYNDNLDIIKECLSKGCDINFQDYDKRTALHIAAEENKKEIVKFLIERGGDLNLKDRWGKTPNDLIKKI